MALDLSNFMESQYHLHRHSQGVQAEPAGSSHGWQGEQIVRVDRIVSDRDGQRYHVICYIVCENGRIRDVECNIEVMP